MVSGNKYFYLVLNLLIIILLPAFCLAVNIDTFYPDLSEFSIEQNYSQYLKINEKERRPDNEIIIPSVSFISTDMDIEVRDKFVGIAGKVIRTAEKGYIQWKFNVENAGLYNIAIKYFPVAGRASEIKSGIKINGNYPFLGAKHLTFHRVWKDDGEIIKDNRGNEIPPQQIENPRWLEKDIYDEMGYYNEPYSFYFKEGENTITLVAEREPMMISYIKLYQKEKLSSYEVLESSYNIENYNSEKDVLVKIQAEKTKHKSSSTIYPIFDQGDPSLEPYHPAEIRLNSLGGQRWQMPGEWVSWEFEIPEDGYYKIGFKSMQNIYRGSYTNRKIYIDGHVPFKEMEAVRFKFSNQYEMRVLGTQERGTPYYFYLEKGKHTLKMEVVLGDLAPLLRETEDCLYELNNIFRQVLMVTSSTPDPLRDYQLKIRIPDVISNLDIQADRLRSLASSLEEYTGQTGGHVSLLNDISRQFKRMANNSRVIPRSINKFRDNIAELGNWIMDTKYQPLQLDYWVVASADKEMPRVQPTFVENIIHEIRAFSASFFVDYDLVGDLHDNSEGIEPIKVWIATGRDQAQILKRMIEDTFTPNTGIQINLELIDMGVLLPATLAGEGPDIAIGVAGSAPVNFALRNAVVDLTEFEDFDEVASRFHQSALVSYTFRDKVYGLPNKQVFPMLFYRKDILADLGLEIPRTWDDIMNIIPELQKDNMNFGLPLSALALRRMSGQSAAAAIGTAASGAGSLSAHPGVIPFLSFLFQEGGDLYLPDGVKTALDSEIAVESFGLWTDLYALYDLPIEYSPENRFRIGEVPVLISNYTLYNMLQVFAPEIRGRWGFTLMPGTIKEDGSIDQTVPNGALAGRVGAATVMMEKAKNKDAGWEFMKWFSSSDTQYRYGRELESLMGVAARNPTANIEAASRLPWSVEEFNTLKAQWDLVRGVPEVPGAYMTGRHLDNAYRKVVLENKKIRKTLLDYVRKIDKEIIIKREEFGLDTDIDRILEEYSNNSSWIYDD